MDLGKLIREEVLAQQAYPAEDMKCLMKLDANESPYGLPALLQERLFALMKDVRATLIRSLIRERRRCASVMAFPAASMKMRS
ncbi:MAG: hypothetical protein V1766_10600 [Pseudomonadota bacterium]